MTQTEEQASTSVPRERAERLVNRAGEQLGQLAGRAALRVQHVAQGWRKEADEIDASDVAPEKPAPGEIGTPDTRQKSSATQERAEEMVDQFLHRASAWAAGSNYQARRTFARLREDVEDIWAEAQVTRRSWITRRE